MLLRMSLVEVHNETGVQNKRSGNPCSFLRSVALPINLTLEDSSTGGETTVPGLEPVSQKLPVILFTLMSCHRLLPCLLIFFYIL
ncbi:hypothetical protein AMECASPLE_030724 [Ameca splendens]|uniref:Uncharacterized protein n=1 Tax=Ameca splendens TaxID=208324 RepID=A0ABV0Y638_9TELE